MVAEDCASPPPSATTRRPPPPADRPSIAVLRFANMSGEDSKEAARMVLRIDSDFSIKAFVIHEPYKDREQRKRLRADLAAAGLTE